MLYVGLTLGCLLFSLSYAINLPILSNQGSGATEEICYNNVGNVVSVTPDYSSFTTNEHVLPCIYGPELQTMDDTTFLFQWFQEKSTGELLNLNLDSEETFSGVNKWHYATGKTSLYKLWSKTEISDVDSSSNDFSIKYTLIISIDGSEFVRNSMYINRPIQDVGTSSSRYVLKASEPNNWNDCKTNDDDSSLNSIASNGGNLYLCSIIYLPFSESDEGETRHYFHYYFGDTLDTSYNTLSTKYSRSINSKQNHHYDVVTLSPDTSSISVIPVVESFGEQIIPDDSHIHYFE